MGAAVDVETVNSALGRRLLAGGHQFGGVWQAGARLGWRLRFGFLLLVLRIRHPHHKEGETNHRLSSIPAGKGQLLLQRLEAAAGSGFPARLRIPLPGGGIYSTARTDTGALMRREHLSPHRRCAELPADGAVSDGERRGGWRPSPPAPAGSLLGRPWQGAASRPRSDTPAPAPAFPSTFFFSPFPLHAAAFPVFTRALWNNYDFVPVPVDLDIRISSAETSQIFFLTLSERPERRPRRNTGEGRRDREMDVHGARH